MKFIITPKEGRAMTVNAADVTSSGGDTIELIDETGHIVAMIVKANIISVVSSDAAFIDATADLKLTKTQG